MSLQTMKKKKGTKPKLTLRLGEILKLIARYEEMTIAQQRIDKDIDIPFMASLSTEEKKLLDLYMEKKIEVIFEPIKMAKGVFQSQDLKLGIPSKANNLENLKEALSDTYIWDKISCERKISKNNIVILNQHGYRVPQILAGKLTAGFNIRVFRKPDNEQVFGMIPGLSEAIFELKKIEPEAKS
nr:hypothetical protein 7 [Balneolaceae bacterium]